MYNIFAGALYKKFKLKGISTLELVVKRALFVYLQKLILK